MSEWKSFSLGDVATFRNGRKRPLATGDIPVYGGNGILSYTNQFNFNNCVVIGRVGAYCGNVFLAKKYCWVSDNAIATLPKESVNTYFLFYLLKSLRLNTHSIGSGQPLLTQGILNELKITCPSLDTQKKIAAVLSALDDKIELNNAINRNLEEQILTLYLNSLEDNKCVTNELRNFCSFQEGYVNPKQGHAEFFNGEIKWLRAVDVNESYVISTTRTLTKAGYESAGKSAVFFEPDTIAISKSGTIGRLGIVGDYMCGNRAVINVKPKQKFLLPFIYAYLKASRKTFIDFAVGSVQKNLYVSILEPLTVKIPSQEILLNFCKIAGDNLELIKVNCFENQKLGELRDALLPKLMSGEIDVSEVEI